MDFDMFWGWFLILMVIALIGYYAPTLGAMIFICACIAYLIVAIHAAINRGD